jgi:protein-S-isoprenylcysteine O-methyltransferase Ste14
MVEVAAERPLDRWRRPVLKALSLLALLVMAIALLGLLANHSLLARSSAAIAVQVAAVAFVIWARLTFGLRSFHARADPTPGGLVTTGPYRFIRHPIYTGLCLLAWAGIVSNWSAASASMGFLLLAASVGRMLCEERLVVELYPEYRQYAKRTWRMVPFVF